MKKGDLVVLEAESCSGANNGGWYSGRNERTGDRGDFPSEVASVIPTLTKPRKEILVGSSIYSCCYLLVEIAKELIVLSTLSSKYFFSQIQ